MFILMVFELMVIANANELSCETIGDENWDDGDSVGTLRTCYMNGTTSINKPNVTISVRDKSIGGLDINYNKNVLFLPNGVAEKFPNLLGYSVSDCPIKEVSKENFEHLSKLKGLWLHDNQIEKIASDTFKDLINLEQLWLGKKFKHIDVVYKTFFLLRWQQNQVHE